MLGDGKRASRMTRITVRSDAGPTQSKIQSEFPQFGPGRTWGRFDRLVEPHSSKHALVTLADRYLPESFSTLRPAESKCDGSCGSLFTHTLRQWRRGSKGSPAGQTGSRGACMGVEDSQVKCKALSGTQRSRESRKSQREMVPVIWPMLRRGLNSLGVSTLADQPLAHWMFSPRRSSP